MTPDQQPPVRKSALPPSFTPSSDNAPRGLNDSQPIAVGPLGDGTQAAQPETTRVPRSVSSSRHVAAGQQPARPRYQSGVQHSPQPVPAGHRGHPQVDASSAPGGGAAGGMAGSTAGGAGGGMAGGSAGDAGGQPPRRPGRSRRRKILIGLALALVILLAWPIGLLIWANGQITHVDALSGASGTPGTTYLIVGNDSRVGWSKNAPDDGDNARADTIMLLHAPSSGPTALISLPRDSYVTIPGRKPNKLNAAYSFGGPRLLVATVEELSGLTVDHYMEIGFSGVEQLVDAVGGVELCLDYDVDDRRSKLVWEKGCHPADGPTALAFSRMRYADPKGDIGRAERQRQVIRAISQEAVSPVNVLPHKAIPLVRSGLDVVAVSEGTSIIDLGRLMLSFRHAQGPGGITGTPPISSLNYRPGGVGSTVQLDPDDTGKFFKDIRDGKLEPGTVNKLD